MNEMVQEIHAKYAAAYGSNLQGCCPLIADEIQRAIGGQVVAGELTWYGGSCRRTHWWVEKDGQVVDPMGDDFLRIEVATGRSGNLCFGAIDNTQKNSLCQVPNAN